MKAAQCLISLGWAMALVTAAGCNASTSRGKGEDISSVFHSLPLQTGLQKAKVDGKLVMVDFYADWCGPCKMLDAKTWPDAEVQDWLRANTVPMKINVDKNPELATKYKILAIPALVFMTPDGAEVGRLEGFLPPEVFLKKASGLLGAKKANS
jgi:thioredoxin 1